MSSRLHQINFPKSGTPNCKMKLLSGLRWLGIAHTIKQYISLAETMTPGSIMAQIQTANTKKSILRPINYIPDRTSYT